MAWMATVPVHERVALAAPTAAERETARGLMTDGDARYIARDYGSALKAYQGAHAIMSVPTTGMAVARSLAALGRLVEARDTAIQVTRMPVQPREPAAFARARVAAEKLASDLGARLASLQIGVSGPAPGAEVHVTLDGEPIPAEQLQLARKTDPGQHVVHASAQGFEDGSRAVTLAEGESASVVVPMVALATAPVETATQPPVPAGAPVPATAATAGPPWPLVYAGFGVGAAGLITGTIAGIVHLNQIGTIKSQDCGGTSSCQPAYQGALDGTHTTATVSDVAFGVGLAGVGVGVVALLLPRPKSEAATSAAIVSDFTPTFDGRSVGVRGRF
jgi:hypothetical protein